MQQEVFLGLEQLRDGRAAVYDEAALTALLEDVKARGARRLAQRPEAEAA